MQLPAATSQSLAVPSSDTLRMMSLDKDQTKSTKKIQNSGGHVCNTSTKTLHVLCGSFCNEATSLTFDPFLVSLQHTDYSGGRGDNLTNGQGPV